MSTSRKKVRGNQVSQAQLEKRSKVIRKGSGETRKKDEWQLETGQEKQREWGKQS